MADIVHRRVVVAGEVQGVFFRDTCRQEAVARGVAGWVRNRLDGTVEAVFEGAPERVAEMLAWTHHGPSAASVDEVSVEGGRPEGLTGFEVRPTPRS
ncbi:acylphosphatase [Streptomyces sp. NPDC002055]|uniref:acylphosphatase n=1 Tax=Streptomyces sp. NPDC002055 TaxID=3154534 RepID=UPI00332A9CD2